MLTAYDNSKIKPTGIAALTLVHKNQQVTAQFLIVSFQAPAILGLSLCQQLNLIKRDDALHTAERPTSQLLAQF